MSLSFLIGVLSGAMVVGSSVSRTISVEHGDSKGSFIYSILNSISYGASIYFIASGDWVAYGGSALGSTAICLYLANKNKQTSGGKRGKARKGIRFQKVTQGRTKG